MIIGQSLGSLIWSGVSWVNEYAFNLSTTSKYITVSPAYVNTGWSVSWWGKIGNAFAAFIYNETSSTTDAFFYLKNAGGKVNVIVKNDAGTSLVNYTSNSTVFNNEWKHYVYTEVNNAGTITGTLYVNGVADANTASYSASTIDTLDVANIGGSSGLFTSAGFYDEVAMFDTALSQADVTRIYNSGSPTNLLADSLAGNLIHYYRFDDATWNGTSWAVPDSAGDGDGTSVNVVEADKVTTIP